MTIASERDLRYSLLFNRLVWPSAIVRDRACAAIVELLVRPSISSEVMSQYLYWISHQKLESTAANALLPIAIASMKEYPGFQLPDLDDVESSLAFPSVLSWLITREIYTNVAPPKYSVLHSGDAPRGFVQSSFFSKYVTAFLPPIYSEWARQIERRFRFGFSLQWAYEWEKVVTRVEKDLTTDPLNFWLGRSSSEASFIAADMETSEVYRSAFLRTLAWAISTNRMPSGAAVVFASLTCPLDLELSQIAPAPKPGWWPWSIELVSKIDTSVEGIWAQVDKLWSLQNNAIAFDGSTKVGSAQILVSASGMVVDGETVYDLEIRSIFQRCDGPCSPSIEELFDCLEDDENRITLRSHSQIRTNGTYPPESLESYVRQVGDWSFLPTTSKVFSAQRWQFWRMSRSLDLPSPIFSPNELVVRCDHNSLVIVDGVEVIGRWSDWTAGLREERVPILPPNSGAMLTINRQVIENFATGTSSNFCWLVKLTGYTRKHVHEDYKRFDEFRQYGASALVIP